MKSQKSHLAYLTTPKNMGVLVQSHLVRKKNKESELYLFMTVFSFAAHLQIHPYKLESYLLGPTLTLKSCLMVNASHAESCL